MSEAHWFSVTCGDPTPLNGSVNETGNYRVGTNVTFSCDSGYILDGNISSTCHADRSWNPLPPICREGNETNINNISSIHM